MKNIPVSINISSECTRNDLSRRGASAPVPEKRNYYVQGVMRRIKSGLQLEYRDKNSVFPNTVTTISMLKGGVVSLNNVGDVNTHMVFQDGKCHTCINDTGVYPMQLRICTQRLENTITENGGRLDIDYTVELIGNTAETDKFSLRVTPNNGEMYS